MLRWAAIFFVVAVVAAVLGFGGISEASVEIAQVLFFIFVALFSITMVVGLVAVGRR